MIDVVETIRIEAPVRNVYDQWTQFESLPRFLPSVLEVEQVRPTLIRCMVRDGLIKREFHAEILEQRPEALLRWRSVGRRLRHHGEMSFEPSGELRTDVTTRVHFESSRWRLRKASLLRDTTQVVRSVLKNFAAFVESAGQTGDAWRGTIERGRVSVLHQAPPAFPGWPHG
jgi:uncharacterized membrane protein